MSRLLTAAAYALHNIPFGTGFDSPLLTDEQAYDVAGYIVSQKRPADERACRNIRAGCERPRTMLKYQQIDSTPYFDAAGFPGRTVGLENDGPPSR